MTQISISKREYTELTRKAAIYDAFARKVKTDAERGSYVSEYEQAMFVEEEPEEPEERISDEVWEEIEAMMEEREAEDGTETV